MIDHRYDETTCDHYVYIRYFSEDDFIILLPYMDDILIVVNDTKKVTDLKGELS